MNGNGQKQREIINALKRAASEVVGVVGPYVTEAVLSTKNPIEETQIYKNLSDKIGHYAGAGARRLTEWSLLKTGKVSPDNVWNTKEWVYDTVSPMVRGWADAFGRHLLDNQRAKHGYNC